MTTTKTEAVTRARKLCRSLGSAPDPRQRVREILNALLHGDGWSDAEERAIHEFAQWVETKPSTALLKPRCDAILALL
jgi:hypothetical protein